ncbi:MAG TPA: DegT/DnrJ/EryC1/StrS family aminotransferase [Candidatus Nanopelagicaceae bacterium]
MSTMIPAAKPLIGAEEREAVDRVLQSGMLAQGPEVAAFEKEFSAIVDGRHCIAVNSGTSGLHMALEAIGMDTGDEVIVPSFTFAATANSVALTGATPVFVDIDPRTFNIDPAAIEAAITPRTKAIQPVHLYGQPASMQQIMDIAKRHNLLVVEDAAQAHMASFNGTPVGAFGDAGVFSFYPTKNMTSGEGGMITTASDEIARQSRLLRNQGMEKRYENEIVGFNTRMTDIHAAIGRVQLRKLAKWTQQRQANAKFLDENLKGVVVPYVAPGAVHVYHQYTIRVVGHDRDAFGAEMTKRGVGNGVYYPIPVHRLPSFGLTFDLPNTTSAAKEVLSIPVHPALSQDDLETIVSVINSIASAGA